MVSDEAGLTLAVATELTGVPAHPSLDHVLVEVLRSGKVT